MTEKKKWQNPELIVLVRGRPEEAVLTGCKMAGRSDNPANDDQGCDTGSPPICSVCYDVYQQS